MTDFIITFVTVPSKGEAKNIASALVENKLAACVSIISSVNSIYSWEGRICDDEEYLLVIKTRKDLFPSLESKVKELHSYKVPEIVAFPIISGSEEYLKWIKNETD